MRRPVGFMAGALAAAGALSGPAFGGTARLTQTEREGGREATLRYQAGTGERNVVELGLDWGNDETSVLVSPDDPSARPQAYFVTDKGGAVPGRGCKTLWNDGRSLRCPLPNGRVTAPVIRLGDRRDRALWHTADVRVFAGPGNDSLEGEGRIHGEAGNDTVRGGGLLDGGSGRDQIEAFEYMPNVIVPGPGNDRILAGERRDVLRLRDGSLDFVNGCGAGRDTVLADGLDNPPRSCERVLRSGAARAVPESAWATEGYGDLELTVVCPRDGPSVCVGSASVRVGRRVLGPERFSVPRGRATTVGFVPGTRAVDRLQLTDSVPATVRSYGRTGRLLRASGPAPMFYEYEYSGE